MIRLFVAITLPEAIRLRLAGLCAGIPGARWVGEENLHLTLRFIGDVDNGVAEDVDAALTRIRAPAFDITLEGVGYFGKASQARILWAGIRKCGALSHLQAKVESAVTRSGLPPEERKFSPHVTLARLKGAQAGRLERFVAENAGFRAGPIAVDRFVLYSSFLSRAGAIHTPEADYPLAAPERFTPED